MKMKSFIVAIIVATVMLICGCSTLAEKPINPVQAFNAACPATNAVITQFEVIAAPLVVSDPKVAKAEALLQSIHPKVAAACKVGATVSADNLQDFAQTVLPALGQVFVLLPIPPAQQTQLQGGLVLAEIAVGAAGVVEQQIQAAKAAPVPASTVAAPAK